MKHALYFTFLFLLRALALQIPPLCPLSLSVSLSLYLFLSTYECYFIHMENIAISSNPCIFTPSLIQSTVGDLIPTRQIHALRC